MYIVNLLIYDEIVVHQLLNFNKAKVDKMFNNASLKMFNYDKYYFTLNVGVLDNKRLRINFSRWDSHSLYLYYIF